MFDTLTVLAEQKTSGGFISAFKLDVSSLFFYTICFGLVAFVLHKFLFKPLIAILNQRDEDLKQIQAEHLELEEKLAHIKDEAAKITHEAKVEARNIIETARQNATPEANKILETAHTEATKLVRDGTKQAEETKVAILSSAKAQSYDIVSQILAKAMSQVEIKQEEQERILGQIIHKL